MSLLSTATKEEKTVMTPEEVIEKIENHDGIGPVDLTNCVFEERINLSRRAIPHSLDFRYSIFKQLLSFSYSVIRGTFIELTGAELQRGVSFGDLKADPTTDWGSFAIFLREAKIFGDIIFYGAGPISTLCVYENEHNTAEGQLYGAGFLQTSGADIKRIVVKGH